MIGESSLHDVLQHSLAHYHTGRNHQGLNNHLIAPEPSVVRHTRLVNAAITGVVYSATFTERLRDAAQLFTQTSLFCRNLRYRYCRQSQEKIGSFSVFYAARSK